MLLKLNILQICKHAPYPPLIYAFQNKPNNIEFKLKIILK